MRQFQLRTRLAVTLLVIIAVVATGVYIVWRTVDDLAPAQNANGAVHSLFRLVLLSLASAVIATALVEFVKRLSPLRSWFNERYLRRWFPEFGAPRYGDYSPFGGVHLGGRLEEVTATLVGIYRQLSSPGGELSSHWAMPMFERWLPDHYAGAKLPEDVQQSAAALAFEQYLDAFQATTSATWLRLLRIMAATVAGILAGVAAAATDSDGAVVFGAVLFGFVIGGPFSWTIRDLIRLVEARAKY